MPPNFETEMKYWAGLIGAVAFAIASAIVVPHPYDKVLMALSAAGGAVATYHMTPPKKDPPNG